MQIFRTPTAGDGASSFKNLADYLSQQLFTIELSAIVDHALLMAEIEQAEVQS